MGTPAAPAGHYGFAVQVTDSNGDAATQPFTLVVFAPNVNVKISETGPNTALLYSPATGSPTVTLKANASPQGGAYSWEIANGSDKIQFVAPNGSDSEALQALLPSRASKDVIVQVTYTFCGEPYEARHALTVLQPFSFYAISRPRKGNAQDGCDSGDLYCVVYTMGIKDQFGKPINVVGIPVDEIRNEYCMNEFSTFWATETFPNEPAVTNKNGHVTDSLSLPNYLWPKGFVGEVNQSITAGGWPVGQRCQIYGTETATSVNGACPPCK
jgi:hypothetical protein